MGHEKVAIIGMFGRLPGAENIHELWHMLLEGRNGTRRFSSDELKQQGVAGALLSDERYVPVRGVIGNEEYFDSSFFGFAALEADLMDPQARHALECAYGALEDAGYADPAYRTVTSTYVSVSRSEYEHHLLKTLPAEMLAAPYTLDGTLPDFVPLRIANRLGLEGQSVLVKSACSSSLLAVHLACQEVLGAEAPMALVCSSAISWPTRSGRMAVSGGVISRDGLCRPFDSEANGTVSSDAVIAILLKRLDLAQRDGDRVYAVISATAANNDGNRKSSFTAPSVEGQRDVACEALRKAGCTPDDVGYIETHGSATLVGDPIELAALAEAYVTASDEKIPIGSLKSNIGHTDTSAGLAGLVKTALCLYHRTLVPTINYHNANPLIDLPDIPFTVNTQRRTWHAKHKAAVHSTGMGGTNVHCILEAVLPQPQVVSSPLPSELLVLSARSAVELERLTEALATHLRNTAPLNVADIAKTLQMGREDFRYRRRIVAVSLDDVLMKLTQRESPAVKSFDENARRDKIAFLCPGLGVNDFALARALLNTSSVFRESLEGSFRILDVQLGIDLMDVLNDVAATQGAQSLAWGNEQKPSQVLNVTYAHPLIFCIQLGLADLWASVGIVPDYIVGYSLGEYVAATLSGVFSREDALTLVGKRARLIDQQPNGMMVAVALPYAQLLDYCIEGVSIAAENASSLNVIAGSELAVGEVLEQLRQHRVFFSVIQAEHAFHTPWMSPAAFELERLVASVNRHQVQIPFVSNVTGDWIDDEQARSVHYWAKHLTSPVRYLDSLRTLAGEKDLACIELGSSGYLADLAKLVTPANASHIMTTFDKSVQDGVYGQWLATLGALWGSGASVDWQGMERCADARRVSLPTYPYSRKRHLIEASNVTSGQTVSHQRLAQVSWSPVENTEAQVRAMRDEKDSEASVSSHVRTIWARAFGRDDLSSQSDFYEIGGHSLLAVQLLYYIRESLSVDLNVGDLRANPTLGEFIRFVELRHQRQRDEHLAKGHIAAEVLAAPEQDRAAVIRNYVVETLRSLAADCAISDGAKIENHVVLIPDLTRVFKHDLGRPVYAHELVARNTVAELCKLVQSVIGVDEGDEHGAETTGTTATQTLRQGTTAAGLNLGGGGAKNPQAAFILSSARSGSTLLRVMLAGHPKLFCPPELHLLGYPTVKVRNEHLKSEHFGKGLQRAIMELYGIGPSEADSKVRCLVENNVSIAETFALLQRLAAPRLVVDKSPDYAGDPEILRSTQDMFESCKYIVLTRHPAAVIESYVRNRIGAIATQRWRDPVAQAEDHWFRYYSNIMNFVGSLAGNYVVVRYEDLVEQAEMTMHRLADFLNVDFHPALLQPYSGGRMVDGAGDPNFHEHDQIDKSLSYRWKDGGLDYRLSDKVRALAKTMGYAV
ncbi:type I polyketide synthase [Metapseudomonas otitidis]|uniref:type I polyketide synthase n=1 Tax=Metapseudomonas otitidis TaxID=319939 RepID=UPI00244D00FB|nr:beta-ketoacyl synthase N-terminal-like domain-containing protein [Pseudomonas otitidis]